MTGQKPANDVFRPKGIFNVKCFNEDGSLAWEETFENGVVNGAINNIFNVYFNDATQNTSWFAGLIDNSGFTGLSPNDTMSSHGGWSESVAYSGSTRPSWGQGSASGQQITNAVAVAFPITSSVTINGCFIVSDGTLSGTAGQLWATGSFSSTRTLTNGQTLSVTYTLSGASSG
jgi:hypothetical protein